MSTHTTDDKTLHSPGSLEGVTVPYLKDRFAGDHHDGPAALTDIILVVEGEHFPAHKAILAGHSPVLKHMFLNVEPDSSSLPHHYDNVFKGHAPAEVLQLLDFMYKSSFAAENYELHSLEHANVMLDWARGLDIQRLLQVVDTYMASGDHLVLAVNKDSPNGVITWAKTAEQLQMPGLLAMCKIFAMKNYTDLVNDPEFGKELSADFHRHIAAGFAYAILVLEDKVRYEGVKWRDSEVSYRDEDPSQIASLPALQNLFPELQEVQSWVTGGPIKFEDE